MSHPALLFIAHGSRSKQARHEAQALLVAMQACWPARCQMAFLAYQTPGLDAALDDVATHSRACCLLPLLLHEGRHSQLEVPKAWQAAQQRHPQQHYVLLPMLMHLPGFMARLLHVSHGRDEAGLTLLLAHGTGNRQANRRMQEHLEQCVMRGNMGRVAVAWLRHHDEQGWEQALESGYRSGMRYFTLMPLLFFSGSLMQDIEAGMRLFQQRHPDARVTKLPALAGLPAFVEQLYQVVSEVLQKT